MTLLRKFISIGSKVAAGVAAFVPFAQVRAACEGTIKGGVDCAQGSLSGVQLTQQIKTITNTIIYLAGILAVIFIIIGGIRYITSQGDEKSVEGAKNTILFAVVGLIITVIAFAIANFVLQNVAK